MTGWDGLERRKFPRANYPCLIIVRNASKGDPEAMLTHTENIGLGGLCLILKRSLRLFSNVEIEVDLLDADNNIKCEGKVVWSVQRKTSIRKKPSFYDTGIEFSDLNKTDNKRVEEVVQRLIKLGHETPYI